MPLPLPKLDDRTYADLLAEARALIPAYAPEWTNHNPSDPGITLVELFAWLAEMLLYRADQVPERHVRAFLKLLNGPGWQPGADLGEDVRTAVLSVRERYRAVTAPDFEALAHAASSGVARARCLPRRNLDAGTEEARSRSEPGHVSVIIVPARADAEEDAPAGAGGNGGSAASGSSPGPQPAQALLDAISNFLEPRRVVTTRLHVVGPTYAPVSAEVVLARRADVPAVTATRQVTAAMRQFLDPLVGAVSGKLRGTTTGLGAGWPFGRSVFVSELYQLLEGLSAVDYVLDIGLSSQCGAATGCAPASEIWHRDGDMVGLALGAHHLPYPQIDESQIVTGTTFASISVGVTARLASVQPGTADAPSIVRRIVKTQVRSRFHPLHGGPDGSAIWTTTVGALRSELEQALQQKLPGVATVENVAVQAAPAYLVRNLGGTVTGVRIPERELADVRTYVTLVQA